MNFVAIVLQVTIGPPCLPAAKNAILVAISFDPSALCAVCQCCDLKNVVVL
jgi:hypothetical protein